MAPVIFGAKVWHLGAEVARVAGDKKQEIKKRIGETLAEYGRTFDFSLLLAEYPDVPKTTFYRWVRQVQATGVPAAQALAAAREAVLKDVGALGSGAAVVARDLESIAESMPTVATAGDFSGVHIGEIAKRLHACLLTAAALKKHATGVDGAIRNPKLYLQASEHERRTLDTASRLAEQIYDRAQIEQLMRVIFDRIKERDPEVVRLILSDLKSINNGWSLIL